MREPPRPLVQRLGLDRLASLPQVTVRLLGACQDPRTGIEAIAALVAKDPGVAARVVQAANSPLFGQRNPSRDLRRLTLVLGLERVKAIAITSGVLELFAPFLPARSQWLASFWHRSLLCAVLARALADKVLLAKPEEAYLAGLLHKVGQLLLMHRDPAAYIPMSAMPPEQGCTQEQAAYGIDHLNLGAWLAARWRLGDPIVEAIAHQHEVTDQIRDAPLLSRVLNLAARAADPWLAGDAVDAAESHFRIPAMEIKCLYGQALREVTRTARVFGIEQPAATADLAPPAGPFPAERECLAALIRDGALVWGLTAALRDRSDQAPARLLQQYLSILFGLDAVLIFLVGADQQLVPARLAPSAVATPELRIPLAPGQSLVADALLATRDLTSAGRTPLGPLDLILVRHLGAPGLWALPLVARGQPVGVLVTGLESGDDPARFGPYLDLLRLFLAEGAELILRHQEQAVQRRAQRAIGHAEALAAARRVHHEANNPLGIIANYLYLLERRLAPEDPARREVRILEAEIQRVGAILTGLLALPAGGATASAGVPVDDILTHLWALLEPAWFRPHGIRARLELDSGPPHQVRDGDRLKQLLLNLIKNAVEAMPGGGHLWVRTRRRRSTSGKSWIEIGIRDSGPGLPPEVYSRLFQPGISTKGQGHQGLGLAISGELVKGLRGSIRCRTGPQGTLFALLLPVVGDDRGHGSA